MVSSNVSVYRNRYTIAALSLIVFASWFPSAHPACGAEPASDEIVVQSPILDDGSMVTIPIRMGKRTYLFAVDTASTGTIFDPLLVSELGKRGQTIDANGTRGAVPVELYDGPSDMWIGKERVSFPKKVGVMSMAETQRFNRVPIMGILGLDCLNRFAIQIDFPKQTVTLYLPAKKATDGSDIPLARTTFGMPAVAMTIGDRKLSAVIDTGCLSTGTLSHEIAAKLIESKRAHFCRPSQAGTPDTAIRCDTVNVAGMSNENLIFSIGRYDILGLWYLSRYRCTIDLAHDTLKLERTPDSDVCDHYDYDGLRLRTQDDSRILVKEVTAGSLADKAGFLAGDVLIEIDRTSVGNRRLSWLYMDFLYKRRKSATVIVQRGEDQVQLEFAARP